MTTARNFDRPEFYVYRFGTHVHCRCRTELIVESEGFDNDEARREREIAAEEEARRRGWRCEDGEHVCPACVAGVPITVAFADGTAPGTEKLHGDRCMCAGAGCARRASR